MATRQEISEEEAALYDRQIRLWGLESQSLIRSSRLLFVNAVGSGAVGEGLKNLVLAGVGSITLMELQEGGGRDIGGTGGGRASDNTALLGSTLQSYIDALKDLNPRVSFSASTSTSSDLPWKSKDFLSQFDMVILCSTLSSVDVALELDSLCRQSNVGFLAVGEFGLYAWLFADFGIDFCFNSGADGESTTTTWNSLQDSLSPKKWTGLTPLNSRQLKRRGVASPLFFVFKLLLLCSSSSGSQPTMDGMVQMLTQTGLPSDYVSEQFFNDCAPVSAVVGGLLAQNVIHAVSKKGPRPLMNWFLFDGHDFTGSIYNV